MRPSAPKLIPTSREFAGVRPRAQFGLAPTWCLESGPKGRCGLPTWDSVRELHWSQCHSGQVDHTNSLDGSFELWKMVQS